MFERPHGGERALLVQVSFSAHDHDTSIEEFKALAISADAEVIATFVSHQKSPQAHAFISKGKIEEIHLFIESEKIDVVLINHALSPSQARNLEKIFNCRVIDRSGLILDIFAQRARTFEGKLQVELAQLEHLSTRLVRGWTHLERQKGGIGLRGPGETQLETDRRLLRARIKTIHRRLEKVRRSRDQNRRARQKANLPTVSLVGYTNAGKSSLFNKLTGEAILVADKLFATLDPTMRKLKLPGAHDVVLADTVGFVRDLPHQLIEAFQATLEESREADLLLHVVDISDPNWREEAEAVDLVLEEIQAHTIPRIQVFNKIDLNPGWRSKVEWQEDRCKVWLSTATGEGIELLKDAIATQLDGEMIEETITLKAQHNKIRAQLHKRGAIISETTNDNGEWVLHVRLSKKIKQELFTHSVTNKS